MPAMRAQMVPGRRADHERAPAHELGEGTKRALGVPADTVDVRRFARRLGGARRAPQRHARQAAAHRLSQGLAALPSCTVAANAPLAVRSSMRRPSRRAVAAV
jgi:hypothetical protein